MQNIGTPRIYVDIPQYYLAAGMVEFNVEEWFNSRYYNYATEEQLRSIIGLNPSSQIEFPHGQTDITQARWWDYRVPSFAFGGTGIYVAILGHNLTSIGMQHFFGVYEADDGNDPWEGASSSSPNSSGGELTEYDGWCMKTSTEMYGENQHTARVSFTNKVGTTESGANIGGEITGNIKLSSVSFGSYFDFPHSSDINVTQSIEMGQLSRQQSVIGGSISNSMQTPDMWGELGAWELGDSTAAKLGLRRGKRIWNLSFSYLQDKDTLPINALGNTVFDIENASSYDSTDYTDGVESGYFNSNILDGNDFFSSCWNKTLGSHLPFIFNPSGNNNQDQFAICKFQQNSLKVTQQAPNMYKISIKIREV